MMRIFICGLRNDFLFEVLSHCIKASGAEVTIHPVAPNAPMALESLDFSDFDAIIQVGVDAQLFSKLTPEQSEHPALILAPRPIDLAFRWRNCEKLVALKREAAAAKLLLATSYEDQLFLEQLDSHPCRIIPLNTSPIAGKAIGQRDVKEDTKFCFISASDSDLTIHDKFIDQCSSSKNRKLLSHSFQAKHAPYLGRTSIETLLAAIFSSDCVIVAPQASQDSPLLCLLAHTGKAIIASESHAAYRFLDGDRSIFVQSQDAYIEAIKLIAPETESAGYQCTQDSILNECINATSLLSMLREFSNRDRPLNSFLPHSSELRERDGTSCQAPYAIFHYPFGIEPTKTAARPMRLNAIRNELSKHFRLIEVFGPEAAKKRKLRMIQDLISDGQKIAFCYSETGTHPFSKTDQIVFEEYFFRFLKRQNIPMMCYVRDAHWLDNSYNSSASSEKISEMRRCGHQDFLTLSQNIDVLATPSMQFFENYLQRKYSFRKHISLPPACDTWRPNTQSPADGSLQLLYSGGLSKIYGLEKFLNAVASMDTPCVHVTVQSRPNEIDAFLRLNPQFKDRPDMEFTSGRISDLVQQRSYDAGVLVLGQTKYLKSAVPKKLTDYISYGLPVLSDKGCAYSLIVEESNVGVLVPSDRDGIQKCLRDLANNKNTLNSLKKNCETFASENTWEKTIYKISKIMSDIKTSDTRENKTPLGYESLLHKFLLRTNLRWLIAR